MISDELFSTITEVTGDGFCLCEMIVDEDGKPVDYRFLAVNDRFEDYTGLKDAAGRTALQLVPDLEDHWIETYARVGLGRERLRFENGSVPMGRWFDVYAMPAEPHGRLTILFRDVSARKTAETEREEALQQARHLLDELNHRVKNSLSVISSIIALEARSAPGAAQEALANVRSRVDAVGELYVALSSAGSIDTIETRPYLSRIVEGLEGAITSREQIEIHAQLENFVASSQQAVSLGLIVNELVTNSIKHAFAPDQSGAIWINLAKSGSTCHLEVRDNGSGELSDRSDSGLGTQLVSAFVNDLDGALERRNSSGGTSVTVTFPIADGQP